MNNILPRVCRECGRSFLGGPRAWYCPECREERRRKQDREFKERKRAGKVIPNGSLLKCEICGRKIVKKSGLQRFCGECAAEHLKKIDNQQSLRWKWDNPNKIKESKRKLSKQRRENGETLKSGVTGVSWDKGKQRWKACINHQGKQYTLLYTKGISQAIQERKEAEKIDNVDGIKNLRLKYKEI